MMTWTARLAGLRGQWLDLYAGPAPVTTAKWQPTPTQLLIEARGDDSYGGVFLDQAAIDALADYLDEIRTPKGTTT